MCIQRSNALDKKIQFIATYNNISQYFDDDQQHKPLITTDKQRVQQVLLGLQSNAMKFTEKGKIEISVTILEVEGANYLEISIIDTGVGIPLAD